MARRLKIDTATTVSNWDPEQALADAIAERSRFLDRYPQYQEFQMDIDRILDKAGSADNRMAVLAMLIEGKLVEMSQQFRALNGIFLKVAA
jgi:hypothetical protein